MLTRLRIFKTKDEPVEPEKSTNYDYSDKPPRYRRKSTRSDENVEVVVVQKNADTSPQKEAIKSKNDAESISIVPKQPARELDSVVKKETKVMTESLKSRAAIFEQNSQRKAPPNTLLLNKTYTRFPSRDQTTKQTDLYAKNSTQETTNAANKEKMYGMIETKESFDDLKDLDFIRSKKSDSMRDERRRHTYETRERELETDRFKRISLESRSPK